MALTVNLNDVQHEPIVVSASLTAVLNRYYVNVASSTYTDPSPFEGEGFIVFVRNGTATVGGTAYATAGTLIYRYYHSGAWANTSIDLTTKQDTLISGINIKTINSANILGSGNISVTSQTSTIWGIYRTGQYLSLPYASLSSSTGFSPNIIRAYPLAIEDTVTFSALRIEVTTASAGGLARLGIYSDSNGYPGSRLEDAGFVDCSSTGLKELPISQSFTTSTKRIWLACNVNSGAIGFRYFGNGISSIGRTSSGGVTTPSFYTVASTYGALPASYPAGAVPESASNQGILLEIKVQ